MTRALSAVFERSLPARNLGGLMVVGLFFLAGAGPLGCQTSRTTAVASPDPGGAHALEIARHQGFPATPLARLPEAAFGPGDRGAVIAGRLAGAELRLRPGSPFVRLGGEVVQLANLPYRAGGEVWVPLELVALAGGAGGGGAGAGVRTASVADPESGGTSAAAGGERGRSGPDARGGSAPPERTAGARGASGTGASDAISCAALGGGSGSGACRVVIDAGHGGKDPGTRSPRTGAREKDIALAVALRVHDLLERVPGIEPILTRDDDTFIGLWERSSIAVREGGDLFVSIHVNAQPDGSSARGFETYFLAEAKDEESRQVALRENSVIALEDPSAQPDADVVRYILAGLDRDVNVLESRRIAGYVQNEMRDAVDSRDRGVRQAPFRVLVGATGSMPAILVELGFITNPEEERIMRSDEGQEELARSVVDAIAQYFREYDRRLTAAGAWN